MNYKTTEKGQSLVEILFAIAVFTIGVVTIGYLIIESFLSFQNNLHATQARLLAEEGLEVVSLLKDSVQEGTFGIVREEDEWSFIEENDSVGEFRRTITIEQIDPEVSLVTATVMWGISSNQKQISLTTFVSNWMQNKGMSGFLDVDTNNAQIVASSTTLTGIALLNNSSEDIKIIGMIAQFDGSESIDKISILGTTVFDSSSSTPASSGEYIDIADYEVVDATGYHMIDQIIFDDEVTSLEYILTFIFSDDSRRHVLVTL